MGTVTSSHKVMANQGEPIRGPGAGPLREQNVRFPSAFIELGSSDSPSQSSQQADA